MKNNTSPRVRFAALGFAVLAISATTVGTAQAVRAIPEAPAVLAPAPADIAVTHLVTSNQAANVRAELRDLRSQFATK
ncbi:hypothetical protein [Nocardioides marmorisolisilvae]|uniref:Uncharacterized protein n=1 Tax=Nocardioides marmorisolisilvae TaxID=1542737 RepID=A0A3N0DVA1_9ACTN|nr:hypothetical protein [Nocardioides marmorisolisilvae]RNL79481.1 hypothetical protein EFL95_10885 [Nocardioides marmorisolisilvae]